MKKRIVISPATTIGVICLLFFVAVLFVWIRGTTAPVSGEKTDIFAAAQFVADDAEFDFGDVSMALGKAEHVFSIRNEGSAVRITKVYTSCMCTTAVLDTGGNRLGPFGMPGHDILAETDVTIAAGATFKVEAVFDPAAHGPGGVGRARRVIYLELEDGRLPAYQLVFEANVIK